MPQILPAAASAIAAAAPAAASAAATKVTLMAVAKSILMNVAISAAMSALQPQVGSAGRTFEWTLDPNAPIPFAAGRVGVAGTVAHLETYGPDKMYYGLVSVLSGAGPVRAITGFMGDDETVTFNGAGMAVSSQWTGEMWFRSRLGDQPDTAIPNPPGLKNNAQLPAWTADHRMSGKAGYMLVLGENSKRTAYPTGEPKPLVTVEGLYGWDPTQDSTYPGGDGPCRLNDPSTWVWLDCPILWGLKWALGLWEGPNGRGAPGVDYQVGGIGASVEGIDVAAFVAASNVAKANGWRVAAYPTTDDDKAQVLDSFLQAGGTIYAQRAGKISCIQRAAPRTSVMTISAADTAGALEIDTAASRLDRINTIRPRFWSEAHRWQMTAIDDVTAEAYRTEDGAVRPRGIDYPFVPDATQAAQLAALQIANTREGIAGTIPLKPHCKAIRPGMAFTITEPGFLLDGLKCLCLNSEYDPMTGVVTVTFVSETDGKYAFALGQSPTPPAPQVLTPFDPTVSPPNPEDWVIIVRPPAPEGGGQIPGFLLQGVIDNATAWRVLVETGPADEGPWTQAYFGPPTAETIEITVDANTTYWIAVSYQNRAGVSSARTVYGPYTTNPLIAGGLTGFEDLQPLLDGIGAVVALGEALGDQAVSRIAALLGGQDLLAQSIFGLAADIEARQRYSQELGFIEGERVGTYAARRTTELFDDQQAIVEDVSLIGARTPDGLGWLLRGDTVRIGGGQTLVSALTQLQAQTASTAASVIELTQVTAGQASASAYQLSLLGAQVPGQSIFRLTETSVEVGSRGPIGSILNSLIATAGANTSNISSLLSLTSTQASSLTTLSSTVGGHTSSITSLFTVTNGLGARYTLALDVDGAATAFIADGATRAILFKAASLTIIDDGNGLSYTPATGRLKIVKGGQKTVLGAGGSLVLWAGATAIPDGSETVDNGILGIAAGDAFFGGRTLTVPFDSGAPGAGITDLSTAFTNLFFVSATARAGGGVQLTRFECEASGNASPDGEGYRTYEIQWQLISVREDFGQQETLVTGEFAGSLAPGQPVSFTPQSVFDFGFHAVSQSGRRRLYLQMRMKPGSATTAASVRLARARGWVAA